VPAFSFKPYFADDVEAGRKRQTIRLERKDQKPPCKLGDTLMLYTGLRTKACRRLGTGKCTLLKRIELHRGTPCQGNYIILLDGIQITDVNATAIARADGFKDTSELFNWFNRQYGLPFRGWIIQWDLLSATNTEGKSNG